MTLSPRTTAHLTLDSAADGAAPGLVAAAGWARRPIPALALAGYVGTVIAANRLTATVGFLPVWPGVLAPVGVFLAGLAFGLRDAVHELLGHRAVLLAIAAGAVMSAAVATPRLAFASALAFAVSELLDWAVYTPLREHGRLTAVAVSNTAGLIVDSLLFLQIAFGSTALLWGQILGKSEATAAAVATVIAYRLLRRRR